MTLAPRLPLSLAILGPRLVCVDAMRAQAAGLNNRTFPYSGPRAGLRLLLPLGHNVSVVAPASFLTLFHDEFRPTGTSATGFPSDDHGAPLRRFSKACPSHADCRKRRRWRAAGAARVVFTGSPLGPATIGVPGPVLPRADRRRAAIRIIRAVAVGAGRKTARSVVAAAIGSAARDELAAIEVT